MGLICLYLSFVLEFKNNGGINVHNIGGIIKIVQISHRIVKKVKKLMSSASASPLLHDAFTSGGQNHSIFDQSNFLLANILRTEPSTIIM